MKFSQKILKILKLNETIDPREAYSEEGSLSTILTNKRQIAIITYNPHILNQIDNIHAIQYHIVPKVDSGRSNVILYRQSYSREANQLKDLMLQMNGYLCDCTPQQARILGTLLQYNHDAIEDYVNKNYQPGTSFNNYCKNIEIVKVDEYCKKHFPEFYY